MGKRLQLGCWRRYQYLWVYCNPAGWIWSRVRGCLSVTLEELHVEPYFEDGGGMGLDKVHSSHCAEMSEQSLIMG